MPVAKVEASPAQEKMRSEVEAAKRRFATDEQAMQREVMRIYRENKADPVRVSFMPMLRRLPLIAAMDVPMFWSPLKQSLPDRLAGTVIVRDRPSGRWPAVRR